VITTGSSGARLPTITLIYHHRNTLRAFQHNFNEIMVGIDAGYDFALLHTVDQFALCGISPGIRLTFEELLKQARRVAALLHSDFTAKLGINPPFPSATANDFKGWLQQHAHSESDKARAVRLFYANTVGHRGLTWRPYLRDMQGELLPRDHPDIWHPHLPKARMRTPPPTPPSNKRQRTNMDEGGDAVPERKRRAYGGMPESDSTSDNFNGPVPERERRAYGGVPNTSREHCHFSRAAGPVPERERTTYAAAPAYRENVKSRSHIRDPQPHTSSSASAMPSFHGHPAMERTRTAYAATPGLREKPVQRTHINVPTTFASHSSSAATPGGRSHTAQRYRFDSRSSSPPPESYVLPGTLYSLDDLFSLAHIAEDFTDRRIAIACLPGQQDSVVTMKLTGTTLRYRVEEIDVVGRKISTAAGKPYPTTFQLLTQANHRFLGRFAGVIEEELMHFALVMDKVRLRRRNAVAAGLPPFPLRERSPSRRSDFWGQ